MNNKLCRVKYLVRRLERFSLQKNFYISLSKLWNNLHHNIPDHTLHIEQVTNVYIINKLTHTKKQDRTRYELCLDAYSNCNFPHEIHLCNHLDNFHLYDRRLCCSNNFRCNVSRNHFQSIHWSILY